MRDLIMVFDTETTDKWDFKAPWNGPMQPNLCQIGYKVYTRKRDVLFETGANVNTTGFETWKGINPDAQRIHGITEDNLRNHGYNPKRIADEFCHWANKSGTFVAHNDEFDIKIMMCFLARAGYNPEFVNGAERLCTMKTLTPICRIPHPKGWSNYKWPTLMEAYCKLIDPAGFKTAHNALADVNPCSDLFWWLVDNSHVKLPEAAT